MLMLSYVDSRRIGTSELRSWIFSQSVQLWSMLSWRLWSSGDSERDAERIREAWIWRRGDRFFQRDGGSEPDNAMWLSWQFQFLSSCVHAGAVESKQEFFDLMGCYGVIARTLKHYMCMVDLLSQAGKLSTHMGWLRGWFSDLGRLAWWLHYTRGSWCWWEGCTHTGKLGHHAMLANLYASTGRWSKLRGITQRMKDEELIRHQGAIGSRIEIKLMCLWHDTIIQDS